MSASLIQASSFFAGFAPVASKSGSTSKRAKPVSRSGGLVRRFMATASDVLAETEIHEVIEGAALLAVSGAATALMLAAMGV